MTESTPSNPASNSQAEYEHLLSFFKYLVTLTTIVFALFIGLGTYLFHSNMKDVRDDAKQEANRVATAEAKAGVTQAFDDKNIKPMILEAAKQQVEKITDELIEQRLTKRLQPIQQRISLVGQISESEMRMRMGFRSAWDDLNRLVKGATDPDVVQFGKRTLATASQDFDTRLQEDVKRLGVAPTQVLDEYLRQRKQSLPANVHDVVQMIHQDPDLNAVALAFLAFRYLTGTSVKMFDVGAVEAWCSQNQPKCQPGIGILRVGPQ